MLQFKEAPVYIEKINDREKPWKKDIEFNIVHEGKELAVKGFVAIRIPGSVKDAGFTLIRRGRVIIGGSENSYRPSELFGDSNSYAWQRLYGELHMDNWPVTQAKDNFDWHNSGLEESFIKELKSLTQDFKKKADDIRVRERINSKDLVNTAINGLAESGLVENIDIKIVEPSKPEDEDNGKAANPSPTSEIESGNSGQGSEDIANEEVVTEVNDGVIIEGGHQVDYRFKYKNVNYLFHIIFDMSNPTAHWLLVEECGEHEYILTINMRHPFFKPLIEKKEFLPIMTKMSIALVLAEIESMAISPNGMINPCDIRLKMNEILENVRRGENENNG